MVQMRMGEGDFEVSKQTFQHIQPKAGREPANVPFIKQT